TCLVDCTTCQSSCQASSRCIYPKLFESKHGDVVAGRYIAYTRPFIIRTGFPSKRNIHQNETYEFEVILFGEAVNHYPYFISAMMRFGEKGMGKLKQPFRVKTVRSKNAFVENIVFDGDEGEFCSKPYVQTFGSFLDGLPEMSARRLRMNF